MTTICQSSDSAPGSRRDQQKRCAASADRRLHEPRGRCRSCGVWTLGAAIAAAVAEIERLEREE